MRGSALTWMLFVIAPGCIVQSEPIPGPKGDTGPQGTAGTIDDGVLEGLQQQIDALKLSNAALQAQLEELKDPVCPHGYTKASMPAVSFLPESIVCMKGSDSLIRVGTGGGTFWIDRYEASIWTSPDGPQAALQQFVGQDDTSPTFPKNGQTTTPLFALSIPAVTPASWITWFQASAACASSGKRLPTNQEWQIAAQLTQDSGISDGTSSGNTKCNTAAPGHRKTASALGATLANSCVSIWGVEDMIGNLWEWIASWQAGPYDGPGFGNPHGWPLSAIYNDDQTFNISSFASLIDEGGATTYTAGFPAAVMRGGYYENGLGAGLFAYALEDAPSMWRPGIGFRCVIPR